MTRSRPVWRRFVVGCVVALLLSGCTGSPGGSQLRPGEAAALGAAATTSAGSSTSTSDPATTESGSTAPATTDEPATDDPDAEPTERVVLSQGEDEPQTRTDEILDRIASGEEPLQTAIDAFDLAVAPLPGASTSELPDGDGLPLGQAIELIERQRGSLTTQQAAIVDSYTAGDVVASVPVPRGNRLRANGSWVLQGSPAAGPSSERAPATTARLQTLLTRAVADWFAFRPATVAKYTTIEMERLDKQPTGKHLRDALMYVSGAFVSANPGKCRISVTPLAYSSGKSDLYYQIIFAHELFHCYQMTIRQGGPGWLVEGSADFASYDLYRAAAPAQSRYEMAPEWWTQPRKLLARTSYAAWPLYDIYRERTGGDVYAAIDAMIAAGAGDAASILAAGGMDGRIYQLMPQATSSRTSQPSDQLWKYTWPGMSTTYGPHDVSVKYPPQGLTPLQVESAKDFSHAAAQVPFTSKVVMLKVQPLDGDLLTNASGATVSIGSGQSAWFCLQSSVCQCPSDSSPALSWYQAQPTMFFSAAFRQELTTTNLDPAKWDEKKFCVKDPKKSSRTAQSHGDPHLQTFDGLSYDAMVLGEFTATEDPQGGFTVQERHEPAVNGTAVTALALSDGEHRITLTLPELTSDAVLRVDGTVSTETTLTAGSITAQDVSTSDEAADWSFTWADGSVVTAHVKLGINVGVTPAPDRLERLRGLLGSANGDLLDDLRSADGALDDLEAFQRQWLVTDATTLFDYEPGESTKTFSSAPTPKPVTVDPAAEERCRDSLGAEATEVEIRSCAFDVSATGEQEYTQVYQVIVADRQEREAAEEPITETEPTSTAAPPTGVAGQQGQAALTITGVVHPPGSGGYEFVGGSVEVVAGTVVVLRASCPQDAELDLDADLQIGETHSSLFVCGPNVRLQSYDQQDGDEIPQGEAYALMTESGTLQLTMSTASDSDVAVSVEVFVDPEPQEIRGADISAAGEQITLDGVGDTAVVWLSTAAGESADWTVTGSGLDTVCRKAYYVGRDSPNPMLGSVCGMQEGFGLTPDTAELPYVLFQRGDAAAEVTITRTVG